MAKSKRGAFIGKPKKSGRGKASGPKVLADDGPKSGHNVRISKPVMADYSMRFNRIQDDKEDEMAKFKEDTDSLIEEVANTLGVSKKNARQSLKEDRAEKKREAREKEMEPDALQELDKLRSALGLFEDSPLGQAAVKAASPKPPIKVEVVKDGKLVPKDELAAKRGAKAKAKAAAAVPKAPEAEKPMPEPAGSA